MGPVYCLVLFVFLFAGATASADGPRLVGYLPHYAAAAFPTPGAKHVDDLIYFGLDPAADGAVPAAPYDKATARKLSAWKKPGKRLLLSVGGWGRSKGFAPMAADNAARGRFVRGLTALCKAQGLDGIDYDWEHPKGPTQIAAYATLIEETAEALKPEGKIVTVAQAPWQDLGARVYRAVTHVHLMSYDHDFPQATRVKCQADVRRVLAAGCPAGKVFLGVPFYGRNKARGAASYGKIVLDHSPSPGLDHAGGYAFNGVNTARAKAHWAVSQKLGGVMVWEITQDSTRPGAALLPVIGDGLKPKR